MRDRHDAKIAGARLPRHHAGPARLGRQRRAWPGYQWMVTGTPGPMRAASQLMAELASRTQPCDWARPSVPPRSSRPWMAIWPGPPANWLSTFERALSASANGPPAAVAGMITVSWTKKLPVGVGVEGSPTTALKVSCQAAVEVDPHASAGCGHGDVPARGQLADAAAGDPADQPVGASREHQALFRYVRECPFSDVPADGIVRDGGAALPRCTGFSGRMNQPKPDRSCLRNHCQPEARARPTARRRTRTRSCCRKRREPGCLIPRAGFSAPA